MTILACVPAPNWVVLGAASKVIAAEDLPLAMVVSGVEQLLHPTTNVAADVHDVCAAALRQFPRERAWTVGEFARLFARAYAPVIDRGEATLRALVGGLGPADNLAAAFELVLAPGRGPSVARVFDPYVNVTSIEVKQLASYRPLQDTIDAAITLRKNPPARKVARLVRKLLVEAHATGVEVAIVSRKGVTPVTD